jgi:hypothetical protein
MYPFSLVNLSSFYALGPSTMLVTHVASATVGQTRQHDGIGGNNSEAGTSNTTLKLNRLHDANQTLVKNYSCEGPCGVDLTFGSKVSLDMYTLYIRCGVMRRMNLPYHSPRFSSLIALTMQMIGHHMVGMGVPLRQQQTRLCLSIISGQRSPNLEPQFISGQARMSLRKHTNMLPKLKLNVM